jgi:hypothetical protein
MSTETSLRRILLIGSGDTFCTPNTTCLLSTPPSNDRCATCRTALTNPDSPLNRQQTSILLEFSNNKYTLVDCGLTFRDSSLKAIRQKTFEFPCINGFVATRNSPDSILGVDDIREVTQRGEKISLYAPPGVITSLNRMFPYIMPSTTKSDNQKLLWTAGLIPLDKPMKQGERFQFISGGNVDAVAVGRNDKECKNFCGFVVSIEDDGRLNYPFREAVESTDDDGASRKSKVALYLPFDCFSTTASSQKDDEAGDHYSTPCVEILKHFDIRLAILSCPSTISQSQKISVTEDEVLKLVSELVEKEWKGVSIEKIVVCCVPHNVVPSQQKKIAEQERSSLGVDASIVWTSSKQTTNSNLPSSI